MAIDNDLKVRLQAKKDERAKRFRELPSYCRVAEVFETTSRTYRQYADYEQYGTRDGDKWPPITEEYIPGMLQLLELKLKLAIHGDNGESGTFRIIPEGVWTYIE